MYVHLKVDISLIVIYLKQHIIAINYVLKLMHFQLGYSCIIKSLSGFKLLLTLYYDVK